MKAKLPNFLIRDDNSMYSDGSTPPSKTTDINKFAQALDALTTDGTTDCHPRPLLDRLYLGVSSAKPNSVVTVVYDTPASDVVMYHEVLKLAVEKQITVFWQSYGYGCNVHIKTF